MTSSFLLTVLVLGAWAAAAAAGEEVAVFVHGLYGWGPGELGPINYWNGNLDRFRERGFVTFEASVGPVSSNWDRACELFAQIKGLQVDYGAAHSARAGHARFGKDYRGKGLYPSWDASNRVHFVAHSMGGLTVRQLEGLLQEGSAAEVAATGNATSELFVGRGNWIKSMTAISSPLDALSEELPAQTQQALNDLTRQLILTFAGVTAETAVDQYLYSFDLEHWPGLARRANETFSSYLPRLFASPLFSKNNEDIAFYSNSGKGIAALQRSMKQTYPGTYYMTYSTFSTRPYYTCRAFSLSCGWTQVPGSSMWFVLWPGATMQGGLDTPAAFRENDGLVPSASSRCPSTFYGPNAAANCKTFAGTWEQGAWMTQKIVRDHIQVVGFTLNYAYDNRALYLTMADRILRVFAPAKAALAESAPLFDESDAYPEPAQVSPGYYAGVAAVAGLALLAPATALVVVLRRRKQKQASASDNLHSASAQQQTTLNPRWEPRADRGEHGLASQL